MTENRLHPRKPLHPPVAIQVAGGERVNAFCRDISLGGMFVETQDRIPYATKVRVFLSLPNLKQQTVVDGIVRWSTAEGVGVQFGVMGAHDTAALVELLAAS